MNLNPEDRIGSWIRATNSRGYRYGSSQPWGRVVGVIWHQRINKMPVQCYKIEFPGDYILYSDTIITDLWPVSDPSDPYEFRSLSQEAI